MDTFGSKSHFAGRSRDCAQDDLGAQDDREARDDPEAQDNPEAQTQTLPVILRGAERRRRIQHSGRCFHVLVVPRQITLQPVELEGGLADAVELVGIDHELGFHAETAQCLIQLL